MSDPFIGEIKMTSFGFAPKGWALCNGQLLPILQNQALFSLLGTNYGGNGTNTFGLPDLRGRAPLRCTGNSVGESGGSPGHTLTLAELPAHSHPLMVALDYNHAADPAGRVLGSIEEGGANSYHAPDGSAALNAAALTSFGGSQAHNNMQPYLTTNFVIALVGIFPSRP
jgi:microcystin-dependent protein